MPHRRVRRDHRARRRCARDLLPCGLPGGQRPPPEPSDDQLRALADAGGCSASCSTRSRSATSAHDRARDRAPRARGRGARPRPRLSRRRLHDPARTGAAATPGPADGLMPPGLEPGAGIEGLKGPEDFPALLARPRARGGGRRPTSTPSWAGTCSGSCGVLCPRDSRRRGRGRSRPYSAAPPSARRVAPVT